MELRTVWWLMVWASPLAPFLIIVIASTQWAVGLRPRRPLWGVALFTSVCAIFLAWGSVRVDPFGTFKWLLD